MVFLFADGFDKYDTTGAVDTELDYFYDTVTLGAALTIQTGRDFDYALRIDGDTIRKNMTPSGRHLISLSLQTNTTGSYSFFIRVNSTTYLQFYYDMGNFYWTMDSYFGGSMVNHGDIGDLTSWKTIEISLDPSGTVANTCFINEVSVMNRTASFTHGNYLELASDNSGASQAWDVDHLGSWDSSGSITNQRLGQTFRVKNIKPTADSTPDQWTAVGETDAFAATDNVPLDAAIYIKGLTDDHVTQVSFGNLTGTPPVIAGVQFQAVALNVDATTKDLKFVMDSSGTATEIGTATTPGASLTGKLSAHGANPITTNAWTYTEVNALIAGVKRKA